MFNSTKEKFNQGKSYLTGKWSGLSSNKKSYVKYGAAGSVVGAFGARMAAANKARLEAQRMGLQPGSPQYNQYVNSQKNSAMIKGAAMGTAAGMAAKYIDGKTGGNLQKGWNKAKQESNKRINQIKQTEKFKKAQEKVKDQLESSKKKVEQLKDKAKDLKEKVTKPNIDKPKPGWFKSGLNKIGSFFKSGGGKK